MLRKLATTNRPILLKRGPSATIKEWLLAAEYVLSGGNQKVVLCERGTGRLDSKATEERALVRALTRRGIEAQIQPGCRPGIYRVKRRVASPGLVSIIVPTRAAKGLIKTCIETLRALTDYSNFEVVCIDDIPELEREWKRWLRTNSDKIFEVG